MRSIDDFQHRKLTTRFRAGSDNGKEGKGEVGKEEDGLDGRREGGEGKSGEGKVVGPLAIKGRRSGESMGLTGILMTYALPAP